MQLENVIYSPTPQYLQVLANPDATGTMPVYSTLRGSSVETPQYTYTVINNQKKEQVSSEGPLQHTGNQNESPNHESQDLPPPVEVIPVYARPNLSIGLLPQAVNEIENVNENPNEESQKLLPSVEIIIPVYAQPDLSKKKLPLQVVNETENMNESLNEESQGLPPSEVVKSVNDRPRPVKEGTFSTPESPLNPSPPPIPPQDEAMHYT